MKSILPAAKLAFLFCLVAFYGPCFSFCAAPDQLKDINCRDCNVILISVDTLRADAVGVYGSKLNYSPNIDQAAERGFVFMNAYSPTPNTLPSHMSIFTSLYPNRHKIMIARPTNPVDHLDKRYKTLTEILKEKRYKTAWFGPLKDTYLDLTTGFERGFDELHDEARITESAPRDILNWLDRNAGRRFFLFLHTYHVHDPYTPIKSTVRLFSDRLNKKDVLSYDEIQMETRKKVANNPSLVFSSQTISSRPDVFQEGDLNERFNKMQRLAADTNAMLFMKRFNKIRDQVYLTQFDISNPRDVSDLKSLYSMSLYDVDRWFAHIRQKLRDLKISGKTIIVITSDHGEEFMEHRNVMFKHANLYEECLHVPLIFITPRSKAGKKISDMASNIDIYPTVLDLLGIPLPDWIQGVSLKPLMTGEGGYPAPRYIFGEWWSRSVRSVRDGSFTYVQYRAPDFKEELYDRVRDPQETIDLISSNEKEAEKYRNLIKEYLEEGYDQGSLP